MKGIIPKQKNIIFNRSIEKLHKDCTIWLSEVKFIQLEQFFFRNILKNHIIEFCDAQKFKAAKLYLSSIEHEYLLGNQLRNSINDQKVNLALLMENIYLKREDRFRENHDFLTIDVQNYIESFKNLKEKLFEIILTIMEEKKKFHKN